MRVSITILTFALVALSPALAGEEGREATWNGYLWRDLNDRVRVGWPVVAMGVMAMPEHVVGGDLAKELGPLLSGIGTDYFFWNYSLEEHEVEEFEGWPRALVTLRGRVVGDEPGDPFSGDPGIRTMTDPRLLTVEFVPIEWLAAWRTWFAGRPDAIRARRVEPEPGWEREYAPKALAALRAMRSVPGPTEKERKRVAGIDPEARVVTSFRQAREAEILRWLLRKDEELDLELGDLVEEFGRPPPTPVELQRWFLESPTKDGFLRRVGERYDGDLTDLTLPHYVKTETSTSYTTTTVREVAEFWSKEDYERFRATTKGILDR